MSSAYYMGGVYASITVLFTWTQMGLYLLTLKS